MTPLLPQDCIDQAEEILNTVSEDMGDYHADEQPVYRTDEARGKCWYRMRENVALLLHRAREKAREEGYKQGKQDLASAILTDDPFAGDEREKAIALSAVQECVRALNKVRPKDRECEYNIESNGNCSDPECRDIYNDAYNSARDNCLAAVKQVEARMREGK